MYKGKKVILRAYKNEDIEKACEFVNDFEVKRNLVLDIPFPTSLLEEKEWVENNKADKNGNYNFAIEDIDSGKYIGGCGVHRVNWLSRNCYIGIMIGDKDYWGKGYGQDAINTLLDFCFNQMNLHKVKLGVFSFNKRAIKCYEKCGFKVEGVLKEEIFRDGVYHDEYSMAIFREEYIKRVYK